jgi:hypothetical protein
MPAKAGIRFIFALDFEQRCSPHFDIEATGANESA